MTVTELIAALAKMPPDAHVLHVWDGEPRTEIEHVWLSRAGFVATSDNGQVCYSTEGRPVDAPTKAEDPFWRSPDNGGAGT